MSFPDILLDTTWSVQYVPATTKRSSSLHALLTCTEDQRGIPQKLQNLAAECSTYVESRGHSEPHDDLNDASERTGQLKECTITPVWPHIGRTDLTTVREALGLSIEMKYQKTTYRTVLLRSKSLGSFLSIILFKASTGHIKHMRDWLDSKFGISSVSQLRLEPESILQMCTVYVTILKASWTAAGDVGSALRQAFTKQTLGSLKLTVAFTNAGDNAVAPNLKTIEFDIPADTVDILLDKADATGTNEPGHYGFLDELAQTVHERMGLKLPLSGRTASEPGGLEARSDTPPLKVTKLTCAAFALSIEGKFKFASKPIENSEITGYDENVIRTAYAKVLDVICAEAERKSSENT